MRLGFVPLFALVTHRGRNCGNPDLAVAFIEVCVLPCGVLLLLRCFRDHCPELRSFLGVPRTQCGESVGRNCAANRVVLCHFGRLPLFRQYRYRHGKLLLKVLRGKSFLMAAARGTGCGIPSTGPQEGMADALEIMASPSFFRLIAASGNSCCGAEEAESGKSKENGGTGVVGRFIRVRRHSGWLHAVDDRTGVGCEPDPSRQEVAGGGALRKGGDSRTL